jgi:hypothetical protein
VLPRAANRSSMRSVSTWSAISGLISRSFQVQQP